MDEKNANLIHEIRTEVAVGLHRIATLLENLYTLIDDKSKRERELLEAIRDEIKQLPRSEHP